MTLRMALRSFAAQPMRSAVLAFGFGTGIAAMAGLLGVGEVILDQSRAPALKGGGDVVITGAGGDVASARFVLAHVLAAGPLAEQVKAASPSTERVLYLVDPTGSGATVALEARGSLPSRDRALGDPETAEVQAWTDAPSDLDWTDPQPASVLRAMDRFHPIPAAVAPRWADSWAEWLYFNGRADGVRFYLTFRVGPRIGPGRRTAGVWLQLEHRGRMRTFFDRGQIDEPELLAAAPDLRIADCRIALDGLRYRATLDLPGLSGEITLDARPGASVPPIEIHGAAGWVSGYVVPVLSGAVGGSLTVDGERVSLAGGTGYHDHNWGFWDGVTWQWGQVAGDDLSLVYGRVRPPADAADPERVPGFLGVLGPDRPLGFSTDVRIEETDGADGRPTSIRVRAGGEAVALELDLTVENRAIHAREGGPSSGAGEFLQLRGPYRVSGTVGARTVDFTASGAAETWRRTTRFR